MKDSMYARVVDAFTALHGAPPDFVARAPGRVNLIGDHTDYNDGFVLPLAIDRAVWIAFRASAGDAVRVHSLDFGGDGAFHVRTLPPRGESDAWWEYVRGVAWAMRDAGLALRGWDGVVASDVPSGAGLSSSAALELATARAFAAVSDLAWDAVAMARLGQRAENQWVGVNCGIMDQLISAVGVADGAVLIDCRSLETRAVPIPAEAAVVVLDSATRRGLVGSAYNERRAQCEAAARAFGVPALRDVSVSAFEARADALDAVTRRRARHVVTENARTLEAAEALARGDLATVGARMDASHASLRDDFEVSRPELDALVEIARAHPACHGARMTGGGFGGCAVALVRADAAGAFAEQVAAAYQARVGLTAAVYVCRPTAGATVERALV